MIRRGTSDIKRRHARNYIQQEANKRFSECVAPYQKQGLNALGVDYFEILLYQHVFSTLVCTCKQTEIAPQHSAVSISLPTNVINPTSDSDAEIVIDYSRPLFGSRTESANNLDYTSASDFAIDDEDEIESYDDDEIPTKTSENLFSANSDCGICYRTGYVPGYNLFGFDRHVLTTYSMTNLYGYHINQSKAPHSFDKVDPMEGFVEFTFTVPKYFKSVKYSIRNNHIILSEDRLLLNNADLTLQDLRYASGRDIAIRVDSEQFTHVVLEFDLGLEPVHANLAQQNKSVDWTRFDTLGNINLILPMTIEEVKSADIIVVPKRYQSFKVTDTPYLRTAGDLNLDWSVNTRVVQPQEPLKRIHFHQNLM
jgi:hypothetical protein